MIDVVSSFICELYGFKYVIYCLEYDSLLFVSLSFFVVPT